MTPIRVQRRRVKGWRTPTCSCGCGKPAIYVGRGSPWGNPTRVTPCTSAACLVQTHWHVLYPNGTKSVSFSQGMALVRAAETYRETVTPQLYARIVTDLRGHDLMCWCRLDQPCHADVLLELANTQRKAQP